MDQVRLVYMEKFAQFVRSVGLSNLFEMLVDLADTTLIKFNLPPIHLKLGDFKLSGYLRHTRFLRVTGTKGHEEFSKEFYRQDIEPGMVVVDGGAHIGLHTILASRLVGETGRVFAFEPDPRNFNALSYNIAKNECENVILHQLALADKVGELSFFQTKSTLSGSLVNRDDVEQQQTMTIAATTLDAILANVNVKELFIKLDLEGAELFAIRGMQDILQKCTSATIITEINPKAMKNSGVKPQEIVDELQQFGFQIHFIDEEEQQLVPISSETLALKGNLYCRK